VAFRKAMLEAQTWIAYQRKALCVHPV